MLFPDWFSVTTCGELFDFLPHFLFLDEVDVTRDYFCELFGRIMQIADRLRTEPGKSIQEGLCAFVDDGFKQNMVADIIWDWIMTSLMNFPCYGHTWLLNENPSDLSPSSRSRKNRKSAPLDSLSGRGINQLRGDSETC
jgi:hypothetical protein